MFALVYGTNPALGGLSGYALVDLVTGQVVTTLN